MSVEFSAKLSLLRKEKNISQRKASEELGISQALLSHYEKGIRECNLDFVKKAAGYYGVTADYLLGVSEYRKGETDLYTPDDTESDGEITQKTVVRAIIYLSQLSSRYGENASDFFCKYFSLSLNKYTALLSNAPESEMLLGDLCAGILTSEKKEDKKRAQDMSDAPLSLLTVKKYADGITADALKMISPIKNTEKENK